MRAFETLEQAFAYYTECALATAEGLDMRKSASQSQRKRAWAIADGMVAYCGSALAGKPLNDVNRALNHLPRLTARIYGEPS